MIRMIVSMYIVNKQVAEQQNLLYQKEMQHNLDKLGHKNSTMIPGNDSFDKFLGSPDEMEGLTTPISHSSIYNQPEAATSVKITKAGEINGEN